MKMVRVEYRPLAVFLAIVFFGVFLLTVSSPVFGRPFRMNVLPEKGTHFGCGTCHVNPAGGGARNPFGKDYARIGISAGEQYTEALGGRDSDGDGFTNDAEFAAGTNPGNAGSKPAG